MTSPSFGKRLRLHRERCQRPGAGRPGLTLQQFADALSAQTGRAIALQTVSYWELGKRRIDAQDRALLVGLIRVLYDHGGLTNRAEADTLLFAGNYRHLSEAEARQALPGEAEGDSRQLEEDKGQVKGAAPADGEIERPAQSSVYIEVVLRLPLEVWRELMDKLGQLSLVFRPPVAPAHTETSMTPANQERSGLTRWLDWLGTLSRRVSPGGALQAALWALTWWATAWMLNRCLNWPYTESVYGLGLSGAAEAALTWAAVNLINPLIVGALARSWARSEWQARPAVRGWLLRAYTFQGAWLGYQIAAFSLFAGALLSYHAGLDAFIRPIRPLLEIVLALWPLAWGYAAAQTVPDNLWRAYGRLSWSDGSIFFVIAALAPVWAIFFYWQADFLLAPFWGMSTLLLALVGALALAAWQERRTGSTVIPIHVWIIIYGLILVPAQYQQTQDVFQAVTLAGLLILLACLSLWGQLRATLSGALLFAALLAGVWLVTLFNAAWAWGLALLALGAWWLLARRRFWIPLSAWLLALAGIGLGVLVRQYLLDLFPALAVYLGLLTLLLLWHYRQRHP